MSPRALPPLALPVAWARMNSIDCTNMPEEPQHGIVDPPPVGLQHFDEQLDDAARRVELPALLPLGARELREEVLVHASENVFGAGFGGHPTRNVPHHIDQLSRAGCLSSAGRA